MFRTFRDWFIPTRENDYRPRALGVWPMLVVLVIVIGLYAGAEYTERTLTSKGSSLAAVVSAVLVDLANADRASNGLYNLAVNPTLVAVAQAKADDMAAKGYFAHTAPDGKTPWYWFKQLDYQFAYAGENLAVYFTDSADVERAWMASPGHRANLLSSNFTEIGIATAQGYYNGQPTTFVVQEFGTPVVKLPVTTGQAPATSTAAVATTTPPIATSTKPLALVKGESTTSDDTLRVLAEDENFIAVKSVAVATAPSPSPIYAGSASEQGMQSTWVERLLTSPKTALGYTYLTLALLIFVALAFMIGIELREQRPKSVLLALGVIVVMLVLLSLNQSSAIVQGTNFPSL